MRTILLAPVVNLLFCTTCLHAAYEIPGSFKNPKATVTIGSADYATKQADDSAAFQKAIDDVNAAGGGHVLVPAGEYDLIGVAMKSDTHLIFQPGVTIRPGGSLSEANVNVFGLGMEDSIRNVSLVGPKQRVTFDFSGVKDKLRGVCVNDCDNFHVANMTFNDDQSVFSSVTLGWGGADGDRALIARNALIENITANDAHYGYGAIQAHSGESIAFRNIKAVGGVAVRLETGYKAMNLSGVGGLHDITVDGAFSVNGQAALMFQPHTMAHGHVTARNIRSDGSEFCVNIANPFVSKRKYPADTDRRPGSYKSITVDGVKAVYRDGPIVTRYPHLKYYPVELHEKIFRADETNTGYRGPSIAAVVNMLPDQKTTRSPTSRRPASSIIPTS